MENPSSSSSSSTSRSCFTNEWKYDVFLSFRGPDTRLGFTGYLYKELHDKGIITFLDSENFGVGEEITPTLVEAIQESRIAVVVFSKGYASSTFCLEELANIMECSKGKGTLVMPFFYHINPSDVRHQKNTYAAAFSKHEAKNDGRIEKWKSALTEAANLSGVEVKDDKYEYQYIEDIIKRVSIHVPKKKNKYQKNAKNHSPLFLAEYPIGLNSRVQTINSLLNVESSKGVVMVGIYGTEGIGKTTLASAVYNSIGDQFEIPCFLTDISTRSSEKRGLERLQESLLHKLVQDINIELSNVKHGIKVIKEKLARKKVLLILDNVDKLKQLRALAGGLDWFSPGSRIILTTRNKSWLTHSNVKITTHEVEPLNDNEARELFSCYAFTRKEFNPIYLNISERVIRYCKGHPQSLEMISYSLSGETVWECNSILDTKKIPYVSYSDKSKEKAHNNSYTIIKVALDADLYEQIGNDIYVDLVDHSKVRTFYVPNETPFNLFKEIVVKELGVPVMCQRFWLWEKRYNNTFRPQRPLTSHEETQPVGQLRKVSNDAELKLFLELEIRQDFLPIHPLKKSKEDLLIFFKLYDPSHQKLRYIGRLYVTANQKPIDILEKLNEMAGYALDEEIDIFQEVEFQPRVICKNVDKNSTFYASQFEDGDIICYQKAYEVGSDSQFPYPDVPSFLDYVYNHQVLRFWYRRKFYVETYLSRDIWSYMETIGF